MMTTIFMLGIGVPAVGLAIALHVLDRVRRREAVYRWAATHGYRLIGFKQPRLVEASGFPLSVSKAQQVFKIEVADPAGSHRTGWLRLGSPLRGLTSPHADIRWDTPVV